MNKLPKIKVDLNQKALCITHSLMFRHKQLKPYFRKGKSYSLYLKSRNNVSIKSENGNCEIFSLHPHKDNFVGNFFAIQ